MLGQEGSYIEAVPEVLTNHNFGLPNPEHETGVRSIAPSGLAGIPAALRAALAPAPGGVRGVPDSPLATRGSHPELSACGPPGLPPDRAARPPGVGVHTAARSRGLLAPALALPRATATIRRDPLVGQMRCPAQP